MQALYIGKIACSVTALAIQSVECMLLGSDWLFMYRV